MIWRDSYGWPVVKMKGKPFTNFMRVLCIADVIVTLKHWIGGIGMSKRETCKHDWCNYQGSKKEQQCTLYEPKGE